MKYKVSWLVDNEVVLITQYTDSELEDIQAMMGEVAELLESSSKPKLPVVADGSRLSGTSRNVIQVLRVFNDNRSEKWGFTVVLGARGVIKFIAQTVLQLTRIEVRVAHDMDEALQILYKLDPDLEGKQVNPSPSDE